MTTQIHTQTIEPMIKRFTEALKDEAIEAKAYRLKSNYGGSAFVNYYLLNTFKDNAGSEVGTFLFVAFDAMEAKPIVRNSGIKNVPLYKTEKLCGIAPLSDVIFDLLPTITQVRLSSYNINIKPYS